MQIKLQLIAVELVNGVYKLLSIFVPSLFLLFALCFFFLPSLCCAPRPGAGARASTSAKHRVPLQFSREAGERERRGE